MAALYEINREYLEALADIFMNHVDPDTGEIEEDAARILDDLEAKRNDKIEAVALYIKNLRSDVAAIKEEAKALTARAKTAENRADYLTRYLEHNLNGETFDTPRVDIRWRKSKKVNILEGAEIPDEYIRRKITEEPDKTAIKAALTAGEIIDGCELVETNNIQIK